MLAGNKHSAVQAIAVRHNGADFWAVQYHPEYDLHEVAALVSTRRKKLVNLGFFLDEAAAIEWVNRVRTLADDVSRRDLQWQLAIDDDGECAACLRGTVE